MSNFPITWEIVTVADIANLINGDRGDAYPSKHDFLDHGIPFINAGDLKGKIIKNNFSNFISEKKYNDLRSGKVIKEDILYCLRGSLGKIGFYKDESPAAIASSLVIVRAKNFVNKNFLFNYLKSPISYKEIKKYDNGSAQPNLASKSLGCFSFPLPPLAEQRRIADKLDTTLARVDALNDRLSRITPLLKRFRQSVLAAATSGRLTEDWRKNNGNPCEWKYSKISDRCTLKSGKSYSVECEQEIGDYLYLKVSDMNIEGNSFVIEKSSRYINSSVINERELIPVRSVIFPKRGGAIATNKKSLVLHKPIACDLNIMSINIPLDINEFFFYYWFKTIDLASLNNGSTIPQVNNVDINPLVFPEPTLEEQTEIVRRVEILFAFADRLEARLRSAQTAAERLTPALLAKAFRGELVPQDPNDEPATELLRRLREARAAEAPAKPKRGRKAGAASPVAGA